jgi:aldehyde dehydrogenase
VGVLNIVNGFGGEVGAPLAPSPRIAKIIFTGSTVTGRKIMQAATENLIPVTLEHGGKSPNIFFSDVMRKDDAFLDKAVEGFVFVCHQTWRSTQPGNHGRSAGQQETEGKILPYFTISREEGAEVLIGGNAARFNGELAQGIYIQPTILKGHNKMRVFQEKLLGPVVSITTFKAEALAIANDTIYGHGAWVWSRDMNKGDHDVTIAHRQLNMMFIGI